MGDNSAGVFHSTRYCCFGAAGGLAAGAIVSAGLVFLVLVLVLSLFDFAFFGVLGSAAGAWSLCARASDIGSTLTGAAMAAATAASQSSLRRDMAGDRISSLIIVPPFEYFVAL
jgi:hypothetical protein